MTKFRVAALQMEITPDKERNLEKAEALIDKGAAKGAKIVNLPEEFSFMYPVEKQPEMAEPIPGPTTERLAERARDHKIYIIGGSIIEKSPQTQKVFNTSVLIGPDGRIIGKYRKTHLAKCDDPPLCIYDEPSKKDPGKEIPVFKTKYCTLGITICADLNFPEIYRILALKGAEVILTGAGYSSAGDSISVLTRSRAMDNLCYIVSCHAVGGPVQFGEMSCVFAGESIIVDPTGVVIANAGQEETALVADLDTEKVKRYRKMYPYLKTRRPKIYTALVKQMDRPSTRDLKDSNESFEQKRTSILDHQSKYYNYKALKHWGLG